MLESPALFRTEACATAIVRVTVPRADVRPAMAAAVAELFAGLSAQGLAPAGPMYSLHLRMDPDVFDFEVGVPVAGKVAPRGRLEPGEIPAARVARAIHVGSYEGLAEAWGELDRWVASESLQPRADLWERYLLGPETDVDPATWRTELNRPLED